MSLTLSNVAATFSIPRVPPSRRPTRPGIFCTKATGAETRENLDHLQQARKLQVSTQPTRRILIAQPAPLGLWDRIPLSSNQGGATRSGFRRGRAPWEIREEENEYRLRFDMPGMTKRDVRVSIEEKTLVINAEKTPKNGEEEEEEWTYGRYTSRIELPENIVIENIKAEVKDGVLYITLPKAHSSTKILEIDVQ